MIEIQKIRWISNNTHHFYTGTLVTIPSLRKNNFFLPCSPKFAAALLWILFVFILLFKYILSYWQPKKQFLTPQKKVIMRETWKNNYKKISVKFKDRHIIIFFSVLISAHDFSSEYYIIFDVPLKTHIFFYS